MSHHELSKALRRQECTGGVQVRLTPDQTAAVTAMLASFGVDVKDVSGFAQMAGQPLLVIHRAAGPVRRVGGRTFVPTEVRALQPPCTYERVLSVGMEVCTIHDASSRHEPDHPAGANRPCIAIDPDPVRA